MSKPILLAGDTIDNKDIDELIEWLKTYPRLTKGPLTLQYEDKWSEYVGTNHSVFVNSGSSANLLILASMIEAGMMKKGDCVVVPSLSWSTDLAPVIQLGLKPVLCDCNLDDLSIDLEHFESLAKKHNPKALMLVSVLGLVPDMDAILEVCNKWNIKLVEDTCESLGAKYKGRQLGSFGLASAFSTYFGHHISTIEGGMVCTDDEDFMNILKSVRSHGWDRDMSPDWQKKLRSENKVDDFNSLYTFYFSGFNLRSTDLQARIGLSQLDKLPSVVENRNENFIRYYETLEVPWRPKIFEDREVSSFAYPVIHPRRSEIVAALKSKNIEVRPLICGSLGTQPYFVKYNGAPLILKNSSLADAAGFYLPNHAEMSLEDVDRVVEVINEFQ